MLLWKFIDSSLDIKASFVSWHSVWTVGPYINRCVPFKILSSQFNYEKWSERVWIGSKASVYGKNISW